MTKSLRIALLALTVMGFVASASVTPAFAAVKHHKHTTKHHTTQSSEMVRMSQVRLSNLGYFAGPNSGYMGPATESAIRQFQRDKKLPVTGRLTTETYDALVAADLKRTTSGDLSHSDSDVLQDANVTPDGWTILGPQNIPVRYGEMHINQETKDGSYRFTISFNGQTLLQGTNQPTALQFSQLFQLKNEDAMVVTTYSGEENCAYKNYLYLIQPNGESIITKMLDSCSASNEVHQAFNALFVRFSGTMNKDGFDQWDVWRYEDGKLLRM